MGEQFVPYELALKLKELGFNEKCLAHYAFTSLKLNVPVITSSHIHKAPLWQQAFDWLLLKLPAYNLDQMENTFDLRFYDNKEWSYIICMGTRQDCIEELIELLENKE